MSNLIHLFLKEVLDKNRLEILEKLSFYKDMWFVLWWGTALALIFWHRESIDFDFFIESDIDTQKLFSKSLEIFQEFEIMKTFEEKNTLYLSVNWVKLSFFTFKHKNIKKVINNEYFNIFDIEDIWAMKLWAIQNRATNKDYVDLYYIINKIWLDILLTSFDSKFWNIVSKSYLLKSLCYFDDLTNEKLILKDKNLNFEKIKDFLQKIIYNYINQKNS